MVSQEEIDYAIRFHKLCEACAPSRRIIARYTAREWRMFNHLPSYGLVGNQGYAVRDRLKLLRWTLAERLRHYNEVSPVTIY